MIADSKTHWEFIIWYNSTEEKKNEIIGNIAKQKERTKQKPDLQSSYLGRDFDSPQMTSRCIHISYICRPANIHLKRFYLNKFEIVHNELYKKK